MANSRGRHRKEGRVRRARPESRCTQPGELPTDSLASVTPSREPSRGALIQICAGPWDKAAFVLEGDTRTLICKRRDLQSLHEDPGRKTQLCSRELPLPPHASAMTTQSGGALTSDQAHNSTATASYSGIPWGSPPPSLRSPLLTCTMGMMDKVALSTELKIQNNLETDTH